MTAGLPTRRRTSTVATAITCAAATCSLLTTAPEDGAVGPRLAFAFSPGSRPAVGRRPLPGPRVAAVAPAEIDCPDLDEAFVAADAEPLSELERRIRAAVGRSLAQHRTFTDATAPGTAINSDSDSDNDFGEGTVFVFVDDAQDGDELSELERRIRAGAKYSHVGEESSEETAAGEPDEEAPLSRGIFCGLTVTEEERRRLRSADPSDYLVGSFR